MNLKEMGFVLVSTVAWAEAQNISATPHAEFEVASIKLNPASDARILVQVLPGGGLRASGATLKYLITLAYEVAPFQISGGPGWIESDRFDVLAKGDGPSPETPSDPRRAAEKSYQAMQAEMRPKLQALLAQRFRLRLRRETREEPVYSLLVGRHGSKLQESKEFRGLRVGKGQLTGNGATLEMLTTALARQLGRPVLDHTKLKGAFEFKVEWTPDVAQGGGAPPQGAEIASVTDSGGPSIFTALEEQLGLKLVAEKGPVEVLVIDHLEKLSEN